MNRDIRDEILVFLVFVFCQSCNAYGVINISLRTYKFTFNKNTPNNFGAITLPLRESRLSQLVGDAVRGQKFLYNQYSLTNGKILK
jgi:hypothetical protein